MSQKVIKWTKEAVLIGGFCDYSEGYAILMYFSGFIFTVMCIQLSSLLPQTKVYISPRVFRLANCM